MNQTVFKRYELKYRLNRRQFAELLNIMQPYMKPDRFGKSTIQSLYLDTPSFLLARRSLEHPLYKEKLRVRSYGLAGPADPVFIELKKKYESIVYKRRVEMTCEKAARYLYQGEAVMDTQIMREIDFCRKRYEGLAPRVMLSYQREAWYGKDDITVNGKGKLTVTTGNGHGIVSKDELTMTGGEITIQASGHALSGKDSVCIADGNYQLTAGTDGIHSDNEEDTAKGFIYIGGGTFQITSASDGLDASGRIQIDNGTLTLNCDDDGIHADTALYIADGTIDVQKSNEGLESAMILIDGGTIHVVSSDDGLNASGGGGSERKTFDFSNPMKPEEGADAVPQADKQDFTQPFSQNQTDSSIGLVINGGNLTVDAQGDGLDSNGSFSMTGGTVYVYGTQNGGNGALDFDGTGVISGGYLAAVSCSTMESSFGDSSSQGSIATTLSGTVTGELSLKDPDGNVLISCSPNKPYSTVQISCPELAAGKTYTLTAGSQTVEIVMDGLHYGAFSNGGGGGKNKGGMGSNMPEREGKSGRKSGMPGTENPPDGNAGSENGDQEPDPGQETIGKDMGEL